jgi:hypothetical protein
MDPNEIDLMAQGIIESPTTESKPAFPSVTERAEPEAKTEMIDQLDKVTQVAVLRDLVGSMRHCSRPPAVAASPLRGSPSSPYVPKRWQKMITGDHDLHPTWRRPLLSVQRTCRASWDTSEFDPRADICCQPAGSSTEH